MCCNVVFIKRLVQCTDMPKRNKCVFKSEGKREEKGKKIDVKRLFESSNEVLMMCAHAR